ncbi:MAG: 30S ribosomal protein S1 [Candidatus Dojkabacteria bacterium]
MKKKSTLKAAAKAEMQKKVEEMLKDIQMPKSFNKGDIVEGTVMTVSDGEVIVDLGGRAEGIVSGRHLKLNGKRSTKKVGDKVLVFVLSPENEEGQIQLSIGRTGTELRWHELEQAKANQVVLNVKVIEANTGGVIVEINEGLRGFVPSSQLKNNRIYSNDSYAGKGDAVKALQSKLAEMIGEELQVKVMEINKEKNKVILSEKSVYSETDLKQRNETLNALKVGDVLKGEVTGIAPFGLFVNAQGLEGLVHLSEISWDKVTNPSDFFKVGDIVDVQVLGLQDAGKRVAYSIKRMQSDPWKNIVKKYKVGQVVDGVVKSVADYGVFVKIEDGLNGLVHISELSNKLVKHPSQVVKVGDQIKVMIISISNEDRHLGLSLKRVTAAGEKGEEKVDTTTSTSAVDSSREMDELNKLLGNAEETK